MNTCVTTIKALHPLVICLTNNVVKTITANTLLAVGASPIMTNSLEDMKDLMPAAKALLINLGTIDDDKLALMEGALKLAEEHNVYTVLDPVGCQASAYRMHAARKLMKAHHFTCIRGNQSEINALYAACIEEEPQPNEGSEEAQGVDGVAVDNMWETSLAAAKRWQSLVVATGKVDYISNGKTVYSNRSGHVWMERSTGIGCALSGLIAAALGVHSLTEEGKNKTCYTHVHNLGSLINWYGECGQKAAEASRGLGSFAVEFLNELTI